MTLECTGGAKAMIPVSMNSNVLGTDRPREAIKTLGDGVERERDRDTRARLLKERVPSHPQQKLFFCGNSGPLSYASAISISTSHAIVEHKICAY